MLHLHRTGRRRHYHRDVYRFVYLSDVLPTAWQAVDYADIPQGGTVTVYGLGPIGQMCTRVARYRGAGLVVGVDPVPERLEMARRHGVEVLNPEEHDGVPAVVKELTQGRGTDAVIDAVGLEAHGSAGAELAQKAVSVLPDRVAEPLSEKLGVDRLSALRDCIGTVRRCGTISIIGVYGGAADPLPMMELFDKGVQLRMGQAHVKRWVDLILPLLVDEDPFGTDDLATHRLPLGQAPYGYESFQKKQDGAIKVLLNP